jgi:outer membrane protein OmpA-like peptidoglycan-associated protein
LKPITFLNLINPIAWAIDRRSGAAWTHDPRSTIVRLDTTRTRLTPEDDPVWIPENLEDALVAEVLLQYAREAQRQGCDTLLTSTWLQERELYLPPTGEPPALPAEALRVVEEEVAKIRPQLAAECPMTSPVLDSLIALRDSIEGGVPLPAVGQPLDEPVYFGFRSYAITDTAALERLRALAALLRDSPEVIVHVDGHADPIGTDSRNQSLGAARAEAVIQALLGFGAPPDCCSFRSLGEQQEFLLVPHAGGMQEGARLNRRVTLTLNFRTIQ